MSDSKVSFTPPDGPNDHDADDKPVKIKIKVKGTVPVSHVQQLLRGRG